MKFRKTLGLAAVALLLTTNTGFAFPQRSAVRPRAAARDFGPADRARAISVTVHLKLPNQALFDKTVDALYDPQSPTFHHWLTDAQLRQFAPPVAELAAVSSELEHSGLSVISIANDGFSIQARGTIAAIERTFHTDIHQFALNGKSFLANTRPPVLGGAAGSYVSLVSGLERHTVEPTLARAVNLATRKPYPAVPLGRVTDSGGLSSLISDTILGPKQTFTYKTHGKLPTATYTGLVYDPDASLVPDYTPKQLQQIYGLNAAYAKGLEGNGQTIVLLEAYGYPTALADANAFATLAGLPQLNSSNFQVVYPEGRPNPQAGIVAGWNDEIALDIQWTHSIAPKAKIIVVATYGQDDQDFEQSIQYIVDHRLGYVVSDSWEVDLDFLAGPAEQKAFEDVLTTAAAKGISFQFSTGDGGDNGLGTPVGAAGVPSVSPHATAVGGTAIVNIPGKSTFVPIGWGDDFDETVSISPFDPPTQSENEFFSGGGGGGESVYWPKPKWQQSLHGSGRQTPDISALADPYTGVPVVLTNPETNSQYLLLGVGGTSLASPIFTAIWALADQRAGHPLGQAAPTIAKLRSGITDVLPLTSSVFSASVTDSKGTKNYSASQLFAPLDFSQPDCLPVLWNLPAMGVAFAFGLGADSSLTVGPGWDNATGYGTPAGLNFIDAAASN